MIFTYDTFNVPIDNHPLASHIPRAPDPASGNARISGFKDPEQLALLRTRPDAPRTIKDYLFKDEPLLNIHVVAFTDATLITIMAPHILGDALSLGTFYKGWSLVLAGKEDEVLPLGNFDQDPLLRLDSMSSIKKEPYDLADKLMKSFSLILFGLRILWTILFVQQSRVLISIADSTIQGIKARAVAKLQHGSAFDSAQQRISDGDILAAIAAHLTASSLKAPYSSRTITIHNVFELRQPLSTTSGVGLLEPNQYAYFSNLILPSYTMLPAHDAHDLAHTADAVRQSLERLRTPGQIAAMNRLMRQHLQFSNGREPMFGDAGMVLVIVTNWRAMGLFRLDFSGAVVEKENTREKRRGRRSEVGMPFMMLPSTATSDASPVPCMVVLGKDQLGYHRLGVQVPGLSNGDVESILVDLTVEI